MGKKKKKAKKPPEPPASNYPAPPHIIGMDWVELPVRRPVQSAALYRSIGFAPRGAAGTNRAVAIGGTVILLKRAGATSNNPRRAGVLIQMPVDNVDLKRQQLIDLGLKPSPFRRQSRGDKAFEWRDPDGHTLRFVGPDRRDSDKCLID